MSKQIYSTDVNIVAKKKDSRKYAAGYAYLQAISEVNNSDFREWTKKKMKKNEQNKRKLQKMCTNLKTLLLTAMQWNWQNSFNTKKKPCW